MNNLVASAVAAAIYVALTRNQYTTIPPTNAAQRFGAGFLIAIGATAIADNLREHQTIRRLERQLEEP